MMEVHIETVKSKGQLAEFIRFPYYQHRLEKNWVPPLLGDQMKLFDPKRYPFWNHSDYVLLLARDKKKRVVGRIAAIVDYNYIKFWQQKWGYFGFFESQYHPDVAKALFDAAVAFLREKGMERVIGPLNPSTNETCGLLIDSFDKPPVIMMPYNPKYYIELIEHCGFEKAKDLVAYIIDKPETPERLKRIVPKLEKRGGFTIRSIQLKNIKQELQLVREVYNNAWQRNWGFVPMDEDEFAATADDMKMVLDPDFAFLAEADGRPVGFSLAIPDFNQALIHMNGKLFPFGIFKLLWYKRKINRLRVITMGVVEDFRHRGVDTAFYYYTFKNGLAKGYREAELSWVLEDNKMLGPVLEGLGARIYRHYRIYQRTI